MLLKRRTNVLVDSCVAPGRSAGTKSNKPNFGGGTGKSASRVFAGVTVVAAEDIVRNEPNDTAEKMNWFFWERLVAKLREG